MALDTNLIAHYPLFDDANDAHSTFDGTDTDVVYTADMGVFNGTTSKISIPSLGFGTSLSFGVWVYTDDNTTEQRIVAYNDTTDGVFFIARILSTGKINLYVSSGTALTIDSTTSVSNSTIYHVFANVSESGTCELFIDSVSENSDTVGTFTTSTGDRYIGTNRNAISNFTDGGVSNVRFYSTTKNQTEIDEIFAEGYVPKPSATSSVSITATARAVSYDPLSIATISVTSTATASLGIETATATASVSVTATAISYATISDTSMFTFVYTLEQAQSESRFKFVYSLEQPKTATIIERVKV